MNVAMWGKALKTIPRLSREEWMNLDIISKWLISTRAAVFVMTAFSVLIGGLFAIGNGSFQVTHFVVAFIGLTFAHATNNLVNDLIDHKRGIDKGNYYRSLYGPQPLEHGLMSYTEFILYTGITFLIAISSGVFLIFNAGDLTLYLFLAGIFFVLFYTWPLKYIGLGEPAVVLVWGPLMIGGTYYVTAGAWSWEVAYIAIAYAIGPTSVLFGKHIDKLKEDKTKGVHTLPVILGEKNSRITTIALWIMQYVIIGFLVINGMLGLPFLIILFALPKCFWAINVFKNPRPTEEPPTLDKGVWPLYLSAHAFMYNKRFGIFFLLALIIDVTLAKLNIL